MHWQIFIYFHLAISCREIFLYFKCMEIQFCYCHSKILRRFFISSCCKNVRLCVCLCVCLSVCVCVPCLQLCLLCVNCKQHQQPFAGCLPLSSSSSSSSCSWFLCYSLPQACAPKSRLRNYTTSLRQCHALCGVFREHSHDIWYQCQAILLPPTLYSLYPLSLPFAVLVSLAYLKRFCSELKHSCKCKK